MSIIIYSTRLHTISEVQIRYRALPVRTVHKGLPAPLPIPDQLVQPAHLVRPVLADIRDISVPKENLEQQQIRDLPDHKEKWVQLVKPVQRVQLVRLVKLVQLVRLVKPVQPDRRVPLVQLVRPVKLAQLVQLVQQEVLAGGFLYLQPQIRHLISLKTPYPNFWVSLQ